MENNNPKISVIVPVYNVEQYLPRCIDSILAQTFTNFELLLIDDGSTDNSGKICDEYAKKDNRIRVFHKENGGVSSARNIGLLFFTGDYVVFVDSDDMVLPKWLEIYNLNISRYNFDICFQNFVYVANDACIEEIPPKNKSNCSKIVNEKEFFNFFKTRWAYFSATWTKCFSASIIREHNLKFKISLNICEDYLFTSCFLNYSSKVIISDFQGYLYRNVPNSLSRKSNNNAVNALIDILSIELKKIKDERFALECKKLFIMMVVSSNEYKLLPYSNRFYVLTFIKRHGLNMIRKKLLIINIMRMINVNTKIWDKYVIAVSRISL